VGGAPSGGAPSSGGSGGAPAGGQGGAQSGGASSGGATASGGAGLADSVTRTSGSYTFAHFPIEVAESGVWNGAEMPATTVETRTFDTVVLENGYLKVVLLPDYGGRVLSIVHKPTGRELLYQNPIGTPYLMYEDIFYYDYLVILGGIFPSFPEPEHGKYWNQPYAFQVVSETADAVTVRMSRQDDLDTPAGVPTRYDVGRTDLLVDLEVTLRAGRSSLELDTKLSNPKTSPISAFEYWTVTTLAPGSLPGETKIPASTRILADMDQVHLLESSWPWFGEAEARVSGEVFEWNNLASFENWADQGTAFANPEYEANWSGLLNAESGIGVVRVTGGAETPGLKLWTFGIQSLTADPSDSAQWLRPTIEMWHGVTPEFWDRGALAAGETRSWRDHYFATFGLEEISAASEYGAVLLSAEPNGADTTLRAVASLTVPGRAVHARLELDGVAIHEEDLLVAPDVAHELVVTVPSASVAAGAVLRAEFADTDRALLSGEIVLE